jgi:hypothetical protein
MVPVVDDDEAVRRRARKLIEMDPNSDGFVLAAEALNRRGIVPEVWAYLAACIAIAGAGRLSLPDDSDMLAAIEDTAPLARPVIKRQARALIDAVRSRDRDAVPAALQTVADGPDYMMWLTWVLAVGVRRVEDAAGGSTQVAGQIMRHWRNAAADQEPYAQQAAYVAALYAAGQQQHAEAVLDDLLGRDAHAPHLVLTLWIAVLGGEGRAVFINPGALHVTEPRALDPRAITDGTVHLADVTIAALVDTARAIMAAEPGAEARYRDSLAAVAALPADIRMILIRHLARAAGTPLDHATLAKLGVLETTR